MADAAEGLVTWDFQRVMKLLSFTIREQSNLPPLRHWDLVHQLLNDAGRFASGLQSPFSRSLSLQVEQCEFSQGLARGWCSLAQLQASGNLQGLCPPKRAACHQIPPRPQNPHLPAPGDFRTKNHFASIFHLKPREVSPGLSLKPEASVWPRGDHMYPNLHSEPSHM